MDNRPASEVSAAGLFRMRFPSHELLIPFTKMSSGVRQAMTTRNIPHSFQSVLTSHHESVTALTATVQSGQARGKCLAVGVAEKNCLVKNMNQDLEYRQPDTIVITSVNTLKTAFHQWTEEQERKRRAAEKEIMLDEETVQHRLGKSRATLWRWNISGYLIRYKVGGKNCYKLSDIERIEGGHKK